MRLSRNKNIGKATMTVQSFEKFTTFLHGKSLRATPVRESIVKAVMARKGHFQMDELVQDLRVQGVDASRATVYRVMPLLVKAGIVKPTVVSGKIHHYEAAFGHKHHDHLLCSECEEVVEFHFEAFEILEREVAAKHGFELTSHHHELIGICPDCRARRRPRES
jgi:Fur family ferric uptake transcriptional regulator